MLEVFSPGAESRTLTGPGPIGGRRVRADVAYLRPAAVVAVTGRGSPFWRY